MQIAAAKQRPTQTLRLTSPVQTHVSAPPAALPPPSSTTSTPLQEEVRRGLHIAANEAHPSLKPFHDGLAMIPVERWWPPHLGLIPLQPQTAICCKSERTIHRGHVWSAGSLSPDAPPVSIWSLRREWLQEQLLI